MGKLVKFAGWLNRFYINAKAFVDISKFVPNKHKFYLGFGCSQARPTCLTIPTVAGMSNVELRTSLTAVSQGMTKADAAIGYPMALIKALFNSNFFCRCLPGRVFS